MHIELTSEQEAFLREQMAEGRFASPEQAVTAALDLLEDRIAHEAEYLEYERRMIAEAQDQVERGEIYDGPTAMRELLESLEASVRRAA
jgi:Arc/MetJ-type ribon-helix-helix transcriptional regulator